MTRSASSSLFVLISLSAACALVPEDDAPKFAPKAVGPQFDADYYAINAKEYMNGRQYGRAKQQWETYLGFVPGDWMSRLGIAFADIFIAEEAVAARGDLAAGRKLIDGAEKSFAELRTGPIESDTETTSTTPMWKAALGAATAARYSGYLHELEARRDAAAAQAGGPDAVARRAKSAASSAARDRKYAEALVTYERLTAMKHASPEAILSFAQLCLATRQDERAETEFLRYLDLVRATRGSLAAGKESSKDEVELDKAALVAAFYDSKISSNVAKEVSVLDDLAGLRFAKGDIRGARRILEQALAVDPGNRRLLLKMAQCEGELQMYETAVMRIDEYLKRSIRAGGAYDEDAARALRMKKEFEREIAGGGKK